METRRKVQPLHARLPPLRYYPPPSRDGTRGLTLMPTSYSSFVHVMLQGEFRREPGRHTFIDVSEKLAGRACGERSASLVAAIVRRLLSALLPCEYARGRASHVSVSAIRLRAMLVRIRCALRERTR